MTRPQTISMAISIAAASPQAMSARGWPGGRTVALFTLSLPLLLLSLALIGPWAN